MDMTRSRLALLSLPLLLVAAALAGPACNSTVEGTGASSTTGSGTGATGTGGGPGACPVEPPQSGTSCAGGTCMYPVPCCGDTVATCMGGQWDVQPGACIGKTPAPVCPDMPPKSGDACGCVMLSCSYACPGSTQAGISADCSEATWTVTDSCPDAGSGI